MVRVLLSTVYLVEEVFNKVGLELPSGDSDHPLSGTEVTSHVITSCVVGRISVTIKAAIADMQELTQMGKRAKFFLGCLSCCLSSDSRRKHKRFPTIFLVPYYDPIKDILRMEKYNSPRNQRNPW